MSRTRKCIYVASAGSVTSQMFIGPSEVINGTVPLLPVMTRTPVSQQNKTIVPLYYAIFSPQVFYRFDLRMKAFAFSLCVYSFRLLAR